MVKSGAYLQPGDLIAEKYQIVDLLGSGAMGEVYICRHKDLKDKLFVLKALKSQIAKNEKVVKRFHNEIKAALEVTHPNVVRAYEFITEKDLVAYTMEYIRGGDLAYKMDEMPKMPFDKIQDYLIQILDGTQALHDHRIIHRDLKPENILLTESDEVKISDFGISIFDNQTRLTEAGTLLGTTSYIAPEYVSDQIVNEQTDIYAIGIIGYELITGNDPFPGDNPFIKLQKRLEINPYDPQMFRSDCPDRLSKIILKAISMDPNKRYRNCFEMAEDLEEMYRPTNRDWSNKQAENNPFAEEDTLSDYSSFQLANDTVKLDYNQEEKPSEKYDRQVNDFGPRKTKQSRVRAFTAKLMSSTVNKKPGRAELILATLLGGVVLSFIGYLSYEMYFSAPPKSALKPDKIEELIYNEINPNSPVNVSLPDSFEVIKSVKDAFVEFKLSFNNSKLEKINFHITPQPGSNLNNNGNEPILHKITLSRIYLKQADKKGFLILGESTISLFHNSEQIKTKESIKITGKHNMKDNSILINFILPSDTSTKRPSSFRVYNENTDYKLFVNEKLTITAKDLVESSS